MSEVCDRSVEVALGRFDLLSKSLTMSDSTTMPDIDDHDLRTTAARTDWSERECLYFEMVRVPREKARSTSTEVAVYMTR